MHVHKYWLCSCRDCRCGNYYCGDKFVKWTNVHCHNFGHKFSGRHCPPDGGPTLAQTVQGRLHITHHQLWTGTSQLNPVQGVMVCLFFSGQRARTVKSAWDLNKMWGHKPTVDTYFCIFNVSRVLTCTWSNFCSNKQCTEQINIQYKNLAVFIYIIFMM